MASFARKFARKFLLTDLGVSLGLRVKAVLGLLWGNLGKAGLLVVLRGWDWLGYWGDCWACNALTEAI